MEDVDVLVIGAGVSGLGFANWLLEGCRSASQSAPSMAILEADAEPGGYCKTVIQDGFTWDYSGHFFHFRHPDIEKWLHDKMPGADVRTVEKRSFIRFGADYVDFPFQKNIHQLPRADFIDCLVSLHFRDEESGSDDGSFSSMLYRRFGRGIAERFLVPYNEKLYATELSGLDRDAMGRFFPQADIDDIIRNMRVQDNRSYNSTFRYPRAGAYAYIEALLKDLPADMVHLSEPAVSIDLDSRTVTTPNRQLRYRKLVSSAPLPALLRMTGIEHDDSCFSSNRVLVFNLGFDAKGPADPHWIYYPDRDLRFYRVGFYDNIHGDDRMSLYVETGLAPGEEIDEDAELKRTLDDLRRCEVVSDQSLVSHHSVVLDPAYVHISKASEREAARCRSRLESDGVYSMGRYGRWTYCSIEDNLVEARELAAVIREQAR